MADFYGKFKNLFKGGEEEGDYDDFYNDDEEQTNSNEGEQEEMDMQEDFYEEPETDTAAPAGNVININDSASTNKIQFMLFRPDSYDNSIGNIATEFMNRNTVILNLEQTNKDVARRIMDFLSGVAYAHNGKVSRLAEDIFIVMPSNYELSGQDVIEEEANSSVLF